VQVIARWVSAFLVMAEHVAGSVETGAHLTTTTTTTHAAEAKLPHRGSAQTVAAAKLRGNAGATGVGAGGGVGWPAAVKAQRRSSSTLPERVDASVVGGAGGRGGVDDGQVTAVTEEVAAAEAFQLRHEQQVREHVLRERG
jgi:hypothetical protein